MLRKSSNNFECSEWAVGKGYYEVATSRLYYSLFQRVKYILNESGIDLNTEYEKYKSGKPKHVEGLHQFAVFTFSMSLKEFKKDNKEYYADLATMNKMNNLRKLRNRADYSANEISSKEYREKVKIIYDEIYKCIEKYFS